MEAMSQQYIQLRPLGALGPSGEDDADDNYFMYDDDDNYQYEVSPCTALSCCHVSFAVCRCTVQNVQVHELYLGLQCGRASL